MIIKTFENGDYITFEKERVMKPWEAFHYHIKEIYKKFDKNRNFIESWWEYIPC